MDSEQIVLEADASQVLRETEKANRSVSGFGDTLVRTSDRSKNSIDRLVASMSKQAEVYGKSGVERLVAQRDQLIQRYGAEQRAVDSITQSYNKMIVVETELIRKKQQEEEAAKKAEQARKSAAEAARRATDEAKRAASALADNESHVSPRFLMFGLKDIAEGRSGNAAAEGVNVLMGLQGAPLMLGGVTAALGAMALASRAAMEHLSDLGMEINNLHLRTGLAVSETQQFVYAAHVVGQEATIYERIMRGLTEATDENSKAGEKARKALEIMGVQLRDQASGQLRSTSEVLLDLSKGLNKLPEGFQRDAVAMDLFKRAGIEAIPVIEHLTENVQKANELGLGVKDEDLKRWQQYKEVLDETGARWEVLKRRVMEPLASVWNVTLKVVNGEYLDKLGKVVQLPEGVRSFFGMTSLTESKDSNLPKGSQLGPNEEFDPNSSFPNLKVRIKPEYAKAVADRQATDAAIRAHDLAEDNKDKLKAAERDLAKLAKPEVGKTLGPELKEYEAAEKKVNQLKEQIKYTHELSEEKKRLQSFENSMNERDLTPVGRLRQQLSDFMAPHDGQAPLSASQRAKAIDVADQTIERELTKEEGAEAKRYLKNILDLRKDHQKELDNDHKELVKSSGDLATIQLKPHLEDLRKDQNRIKEQDKSDLDQFSLDVEHAGRMSSIRSNKQGFAGELGEVQQTYAIKQQIRNVEVDTMKAHEGAYAADKDGLGIAKELARIELDSTRDRYALEEKILEVKQKEFEQVKQTTEKLVETLLTKPQNFGKEFGNTIHQAILKPVVQGISSTISTVVTPIVYGQDGRSGISGALHGIFGGQKQDPMKMSTDINSQVTTQNTSAMYAMISALSRVGLGGGSAVAPGSSFSNLLAYTGGGGINASSSVYQGGASSPSFGDLVNTPLPGGTSSPGLGGLFGDVGGYLGGGGGYSGGGSDQSYGLPSLSTGGRAGIGGILGGFGKMAQGAFGHSSGSGSSGGVRGILGNLKGTNWGGFTRADAGGTPGEGDQPGTDLGNTGRINGVGGVAGGLLASGGMMLAQRGLLGADRGTWKGTFEGAAGGAAIGFKYGGPIGAAIGGAVGLGIGLGEHFAGVESPENEAKRLVKQIYGITIDAKMAEQIVQLAQQKYSSHVSIAVRDPDIRKMLQLYATGTGQKFPLSATTPQGAVLQEQGGKLYQAPSFVNGNPYTFQSNLPVAGGFATGQYPSPSGPIVLNVNGQSAADLLEGRIANTVTPGYVQDQYSSAMSSSNGRLANSATIQQPGLITS